MTKAIIFDLDNTLLDRDASLKSFIKSQYNKFHTELKNITSDDYSTKFIKVSQSIYIGDNPTSDIEAAQKAGMKAIWKRNKNYNDCQWADAAFEDFDALPEIIEKLY